MEAVFNVLFHGLELKPTGLILGAALVAAHVFALVRPEPVKAFLKAFPRNRKAGITVLAVTLAWAWIIIRHMDLGEFHNLRTLLSVLLPVGFVLVIQFVDEFLAVRALGALALLAANPLLQAAFLEPPVTRLLLPVLAYAWIVLGLFWVGMPFTLRDQIGWVTATPGRFRACCVGGIVYGALVLVCAVAFW